VLSVTVAPPCVRVNSHMIYDNIILIPILYRPLDDSRVAYYHRPMEATDLIRWRGRHGLTQTDAAKRLGVAAITLQKWEQGQNPVPPMADKLVAALEKLSQRPQGSPSQRITVHLIAPARWPEVSEWLHDNKIVCRKWPEEAGAGSVVVQFASDSDEIHFRMRWEDE
jgi:DNA-binding transcriptional regulator YiaG